MAALAHLGVLCDKADHWNALGRRTGDTCDLGCDGIRTSAVRAAIAEAGGAS